MGTTWRPRCGLGDESGRVLIRVVRQSRTAALDGYGTRGDPPDAHATAVTSVHRSGEAERAGLGAHESPPAWGETSGSAELSTFAPLHPYAQPSIIIRCQQFGRGILSTTRFTCSA